MSTWAAGDYGYGVHSKFFHRELVSGWKCRFVDSMAPVREVLAVRRLKQVVKCPLARHPLQPPHTSSSHDTSFAPVFPPSQISFVLPEISIHPFDAGFLDRCSACSPCCAPIDYPCPTLISDSNLLECSALETFSGLDLGLTCLSDPVMLASSSPGSSTYSPKLPSMNDTVPSVCLKFPC